MISTKQENSYPYLFGSRVGSHLLFWFVYYIAFGFLWAQDGDYYKSFGLEFVLMPIRIGISYLTMYLLIPKFLLDRKWVLFLANYGGALVLAGILQRVVIYYFYELFFSTSPTQLWDIQLIVRSMVLVNSTVLFLSAIKMYDYWSMERASNAKMNEPFINIRAEKRNYRIKPSDILYVEGLGNYVTFYLENRKPLISYLTLKEAEKLLPKHFIRSHKSFLVNKDKILSYTTENVEVGGRIIPIGKSLNVEI